MTRYTKRQREQAAMILQLCASSIDEDYAGSIETAAAFIDFTCDHPDWKAVEELARGAWKATFAYKDDNYTAMAGRYDCDERDKYAAGRRCCYAEAECLIRTGYTP